MYVVYYDGCQQLDTLCNIGDDDDEVYPWPTLSSAAKDLYRNNANGWTAFHVDHSASPWNKKALGEIRTASGGPGFRNTLGNLCQQQRLVSFWSNSAQR